MYWEGSWNKSFTGRNVSLNGPPSSELPSQALVILYNIVTLIFGELILIFLHSLNKMYGGLIILKSIYQIPLLLNIGGFPVFAIGLNVLSL